VGRHQPNIIPLTVEFLPDGRWRVETPLTRGWSSVVRTPAELGRALATARVEVTVAAYARSRNAKYDLSRMTEEVPGDPRTALVASAAAPPTHRTPRNPRPARHDPAAWRKMPDGRWQSPNGMNYRADAKVVQNVVKLRAERGLPT